MTEIRYGSVEPSKKLYSKIGTGASYTLDEVLAELIDNALDARTEHQLKKIDPETMIVDISIDRNTIEVRDNAKGMNGKNAVGALKLGDSTDASRKLSGFGLGLKTGALSIGNNFDIISGIEGIEERNKVNFNIFKWETNPELGFNKPYPYEVVHKPRDEHGTKIVITDLRTNITPKKIEETEIAIGNRYMAYLKNNEVIIRINGIPVKPEKIEWRSGYPVPIAIDTKYGKITGILGITEHMTYTGGWGLDLFRNNRLISQKEKFGKMFQHPTYALMRGELHFDFVPVNNTKNKFIQESDEWDEALRACKGDAVFNEVVKKIIDLRWNPDVSKKVKKKVDAKLEVLARILDRKYREEFKPNTPVGVEAGKGRTGIEEVLIEQRESPIHHDGTHQPGDGTRKRRPKKMQYVKRLKFKQTSGKIFYVEYDFNNVPGGRRKELIDEKHRLVVYTNIAFSAYKNTTDESFYILENVIDAMMEQRARDNNMPTDKYVEMKESLLSEMYSEKERRAIKA